MFIVEDYIATDFQPLWEVYIWEACEPYMDWHDGFCLYCAL